MKKASKMEEAKAKREVLEALKIFMADFELVFEHDWAFTRVMFQADIGYYIAPKGTFLNPRVEDESNNWANRGALLGSYRKLVAAMNEAGMQWNWYHFELAGEVKSD